MNFKLLYVIKKEFNKLRFIFNQSIMYDSLLHMGKEKVYCSRFVAVGQHQL